MKTSRAAIVRADDPDYWELKAQETLGEVVFLGDGYTKDGVLQAAFLVEGPVPSFIDNPDDEGEQMDVTIGEDSFSRVLDDYQNWRLKWWREAIQNSVDAGATKIECASVYDKEKNVWTVSCTDNGNGMDKETIITKFLKISGSGKRDDPTKRGGFGKAKEMLILPWLSWELHTRDLLVKGRAIKSKGYRAEYLKGTRLSVVMPGDNGKYTNAGTFAHDFVKKCDIPGVEFRIIQRHPDYSPTDKTIYADRKAGELVRSLTGLDVHFTRSKSTDSFTWEVDIRVQGLYMFTKYTDKIPGDLIIETTIPSTKLLLSNREGFVNSDVQKELDKYIVELTKGPREALEKKSNLIREKFKGSGKFVGARERQFKAMFEGLLASLGGGQVLQSQKIILNDIQRTEYAKVAHNVLGNFQSEKTVPEGHPDENIGVGAPSDYAVPPDAVKAIMSIIFTGPNHLEAAIKQLAWEPDYFIANDIPGFVPSHVYWPDKMSAKVKKLVRFWAELCRFVLIQIGCPKSYGVGVHFSKSTAGSHFREADKNGLMEDWLMLNPIKVTIEHGYVDIGDPVTAPIYDINDPKDVAIMYSIAVHECTHFADDLKHHDEAFAAAMTFNVARTSGMEKQIKEILNSVRSTTTVSGRPRKTKREDISLEEMARNYAQRVVNDALRKGMPQSDAQKFWQPAYDRYMMKHLKMSGEEPL